MSAILIFFTAMLIFALLAGWWYWIRVPRRQASSYLNIATDAPARQISAEEQQAVEKYLHSLQSTDPSGLNTVPPTAVPDSRQQVLTLNCAITRYSINSNSPNPWRYYLDSVEVHLPPFWEQYITDENRVELLRSTPLPLVISLNGHTLSEYMQEARSYASGRALSTQASIRGEEREHIELRQIRQETPAEHKLKNPDALSGPLLIVAAFLLLAVSLTTPDVFVPWLAVGAVVFLLSGLWQCFAPPMQHTLSKVHCLHGTPKRWGLFGENNQEQANTISLGILDLTYPSHWQPYIREDLGQPTDIDIYPDRNVVRLGRFLSLHDEVTQFPLQHWRRNAVLAAGSLLVLVILFLAVPLGMPVKFTLSWMQNAETREVSSIKQLSETSISVGERLKINGTGMCSIVPAGNPNPRDNSPFTPFDCSQIIWNDATPKTLETSDTLNNATALLQSVNRQLHPPADNGSRVSAGLRSAIQKSGMVLLDDFSDIVLKTQNLCTAADDCVRLKNALVNLGNSKDWPTLIRLAKSGKLNAVNVLLRPVSAESLENLVTTSTGLFMQRETTRTAQNLSRPLPGGFIIASNEGSNLISQPYPPLTLYEYPPQEQWPAFQRLATMLLHTPFSTEGIVTGVYTDASRTQHVILHRIPDSSGKWRYICTALLLLAMIACALYNSIQALRRYQRHHQRLELIGQYYANCINAKLLPTVENPLQ